ARTVKTRTATISTKRVLICRVISRSKILPFSSVIFLLPVLTGVLKRDRDPDRCCALVASFGNVGRRAAGRRRQARKVSQSISKLLGGGMLLRARTRKKTPAGKRIERLRSQMGN